jgi:hypothetical protein
MLQEQEEERSEENAWNGSQTRRSKRKQEKNRSRKQEISLMLNLSEGCV